VFIPGRLTNKIFLHTSTKCVCPSETFRTSYLVFSIVVFRQTTSAEHTISILFLVFFRRIVSERNREVSVRMWWSVGRCLIPANPSLLSFWRTKKSIRRKPAGFGFSGLFCFLFLSCLNKIFCKVNSLFSLLFHHEDLALGSDWHRADIWWSESLSRSERRKISRTEWWLIAGLYQSGMVRRSGIFVLWGQGNHMVWRCSCHKERGLSPGSH